MNTSPLTWLYAPAIRPELMEKSLDAGADAVIYDLEDAVVADRKLEARELVIRQLNKLAASDRGGRPAVLVRVNALASEYGEDDIAAISGHPAVKGVRLPKVDDPSDVVRAGELLGGASAPALYPLLESALAIERAFDIANAHPAIGGLVIGEQDLRAELGLHTEEAFAWIRSRVVVAARAAGLPAPPMNVYPRVSDLAGLEASCRTGRYMGFFGRSALHPRQIPVIRQAFTPTPDEVEAAQKVVEAAASASREGSGAFVLPNGRFVDEPIVTAAHQTVALARRLLQDDTIEF